MPYNTRYFIEDELWQLRPRRKAINTYITSDGVIIGMFQGSRGQFPLIDFVIRVLKEGEDEKPFSPPHSFWVVDLMLKINEYRNDVRSILQYYTQYYENLNPFQNPNDRNNYACQTVDFITEQYSHIEQENTLSLEYVAIIIELFCLNEKRNDGAYMFRDLLQTLLDYTNGEADYIEVMQASQPGYR